MNHIVVIGFMGSGKTRVGKRLAQDLEMPFLDVDKKIAQNMKMSVKELLDKFGEPFYRALETYTGKEMLKVKEPTVISVSAGFPLQGTKPEIFKRTGYCNLSERLGGDAEKEAGGEKQSFFKR